MIYPYEEVIINTGRFRRSVPLSPARTHGICMPTTKILKGIPGKHSPPITRGLTIPFMANHKNICGKLYLIVIIPVALQIYFPAISFSLIKGL